jgi:DNA-binding NarL/FixJ family response regulator
VTRTEHRTLIITDNVMSATLIRRSLRDASFGNVIGFINLRRECEPDLRRLAPDVIIVDEAAAREHVIARIGDARAALPSASIILLAADMDPRWLLEAASAGIDTALRRRPDAISLGALIREVVDGNIFNANTAERTIAAPEPVTDLTGRELEILRLVAAGFPNGAIATQLWITEQTVKFHLSNVYRKLGVQNRTQASHIAHTNGLLETATALQANGIRSAA